MLWVQLLKGAVRFLTSLFVVRSFAEGSRQVSNESLFLCGQLLKGADTWDDAAALCEQRGQRLASLHTVALSRGMLQLLNSLNFPEPDNVVFIGLRTPTPVPQSPL